jgi:hypothetical protein
VVGVTFDLGRAPFVTLDEKSGRVSANRHCAREEERVSRDRPVRLDHVRAELLAGRALAASGPGEGGTRTDQSQKVAASHRVRGLVGAWRELPRAHASDA